MFVQSIVRPGTYKIAVYRTDLGPETLLLTALEGGVVTVTEENPEQARDQKWSAHPAPNEGLVIQIPAHLFHSRSLCYREPELGEKIILGPVSDFPTREWCIDAALQKPLPVPFFIRVPDTDLIVVVPKLTIFPLQVCGRMSVEGTSIAPR